MKRWPLEYWKKLIQLLPNQRFVVLGGPDDQFCQELADLAPGRVINQAGKLTWVETAQEIRSARAVVSGDTGVMHIADAMATPVVAIIGPTAFGYPSRSTSLVVETKLDCKPCSKDGRGRCRNSQYKFCLTSLAPETVSEALKALL